MASQYKKSWQTFAEVTTIHGVHDMVFANAKVTRVLWIAVMLASVGLLGYQAFKIIRDYHEGATTFQTSNIPLDKFPPIRLFSHRFFDLTKTGSDISNEHVCFLMGYFKDWPFKRSIWPELKRIPFMDESRLVQMEQEIEVAVRNRNMKNAVQLAEYFVYDESKIVTAKNLSLETAAPSVSKLVDSYGISYIIETSRSINPGRDIPWESVGAVWGFTLALQDTVCYDPESPVSKNRIIMAVGNHIFEKDQWIEFDLDPGRDYDIVLSPYKKHLVNKHDGNCHDGNMTKSQCYRDCQTQRCNFYDQSKSMYNYICPLNDTVFFSGDSTYSGKFYNWLHGMKSSSGCNEAVMQKIEACMRSCNNPCEREGFTTQITRGRQNSYFRRKFGLGLYTDIVVVKMMPGWSVAFVEEEYVYSSVAVLMSNFGGLLGLFIGASVISILQLMVYTFCGTWVTKREDGVATEASVEKKDGGLKEGNLKK